MPNHYGNTRNLSPQPQQAQLNSNSAEGRGKKLLMSSPFSKDAPSKSKIKNGKVIIDLAKKYLIIKHMNLSIEIL